MVIEGALSAFSLKLEEQVRGTERPKKIWSIEGLARGANSRGSDRPTKCAFHCFHDDRCGDRIDIASASESSAHRVALSCDNVHHKHLRRATNFIGSNR